MFLSLQRKPKINIMIDSLKRLPEQISSVMFAKEDALSFLKTDSIQQIVVNGMGGSNLGAYITQSIFKNRLKIPLLIEPGYTVPAYVNKHTLYIISSYSGTTEEPLAAYAAAKRRGAKILIISSNNPSPLQQLARRENLPSYFFSTVANPSGQPRLGLGYSVATFLAIFKKLKLISITEKEIKSIVNQLKRKNNLYLKATNEAKKLAKQLANRELILIGGSLFAGNLQTLRNQSCETAKNFASYLILSDMNHFSLEGLKKPSNNKKRLAVLCFNSDLYSQKIKKRLELTKTVIKNNGIPVLSYTPSGTSALAQSFDLLQFSSWLTYYLSLHNHVDPLTVPWVDWFKKQLSTK